MVLRGHSMHVAYAEWCRTIWSDPCLKSGLILPKELAKGFSDSDCGVCGHWLRDASARQEATANQAAVEATPEHARRAAALASMPGRSSTRGKMTTYYGRAGSVGNRFSERFNQLRVRQRLTHVLRLVIRHAGGWKSMHDVDSYDRRKTQVS